ncbi:TerD family protein [Streptomyces sp. NPDC086766]|uniref:TerD family protein n=1 Tax=Streptomyces sp. NPDC086766 TaxID=3365754 RepID=UPI0037F71E18
MLTRLPDTHRLGFVAYGRWTREAIESTPWREPEDALRFLDVGQDVTCSVTTTASGSLSTALKPLDIIRVPGLQDLLGHALDDPDSDGTSLAGLDISLGGTTPSGGGGPVADRYRVKPFAQWKQAAPVGSPPLPPVPAVVLPEEAWQGLRMAFSFAGADSDLTLFLTGHDGRVAGDEDFVFYHHPSAADGAARLLGKQPEGPHTVERATVHLSALPEHVRRVAIAINMDVDTGLTCVSLTHAALLMDCATGAAWTFQPPADPNIRAMVVAELYRHTVDNRPAWKLRAIGQGWAEGVDALARAYGVDVE